MYFGTFSCHRWLPLIEATEGHDLVYRWMHAAHGQGYRFCGYSIMPNHVHFIIRVPDGGTLNTMLANGKRLMAYGIVQRLQEQGRTCKLPL